MILTEKKLGKLPAKSDTKALMFANYLPKKAITLPVATNFWTKRAPFPRRMFGNDKLGDCTRASQAIAAMRMERIEQGKTIDIADEEVIRVYLEMTDRLYGGGDTGGFEEDALNEWRKPDTTLRDTKGNPLTIEAFTRVNQANITEVKTAIATSLSHGIKLCFRLPAAWENQNKVWDIPAGQKPIGSYLPSSWGDHSTFCIDYDAFGIILPTWDIQLKVSWRAVAIYSDEAHSIIDSIDNWKKKGSVLNLSAIRADVNAVSSHKIK